MERWRYWLALVIWALAILIQWPLWFGKGGWLKVSKLEQRLVDTQQQIEREKTSNEALYAEVMSLRQGTDAIEERARRELYMVRGNEVLFRVKNSPEEEARLAQEEARRAADEVKAESRALEKSKEGGADMGDDSEGAAEEIREGEAPRAKADPRKSEKKSAQGQAQKR